MASLFKLHTTNERYPALTGIRAVGASVVFFDHFPFPQNGHVTINVMAFFFVLSGFLIVRLYYNKVSLTGKNMRVYFVNRFARIYPVYFLLLTIAVLLKHDYRPWLLFKNYTLTHALINNNADIIINQSWTLTVEECFYFLAPLIIFIIKKINFWAAVGFACALLGIALLIARPGILLFKEPLFVFSTTFFGHFAEFYAGVYLALVMMKKEKQGPIKIAGLKWSIMGACGVVALVLVMAYIYAHPPLNTPAIVLINNFLIPVPIAVLYYGLMCENTGVSRFLSSRLMAWLGKGSYAFYLVHGIIIFYIVVPYVLPYFNEHYVACSIVTYIVTYALSVLLFMLYEEPLNIFIRKKFIPKGQPAVIHVLK